MAANAIRTFDINSGPCPGIPAGAEAYSLNFAVTETTGAPGDIRVFPTGSGVSITSVLNWNFVGNGAIANAIIIPAGTNGAIDVQVAGFDTHLVIDINGYYAPISIVNTVNGLSGAVTLAQGTNISITPSGNTLTIASTGGGAGWSLTGNSGTTPGTNFLGTTDDVALEVKVNGARALRIEPATSPNVIGGSEGNLVNAGVVGATVSGGGTAALINRVTDDYGFVGGGNSNRAGDNAGTTVDRAGATVVGGSNNVASGLNSVVAGGFVNTAGDHSAVVGGVSNDATSEFNFIGGGNNNTAGLGAWNTVCGGIDNIAMGSAAAVGGGSSNVANVSYATIPGGRSNGATGMYSFAAGRRAKAVNQGAFVWADSTDADVLSTGVNQFLVRAAGGLWFGTTSAPSFDIATDFLRTSTGAHLTIGGVWTDNSDRDSKENFQEVDRREVLSKVLSLPITRWSYKAERCEIEHLGPMAQDFSAAFGLGSDDRSISTLDSSGVALASIQALYEMVKEKDAEIDALKGRLSKLEAKVE
jgi:hypothetical protein